MSDRCYDTLCFIAKLVAPIATLVSAILSIWGIPYGEQITATLSAVDVFMGAFVVVAKSRYDSGKGTGL